MDTTNSTRQDMTAEVTTGQIPTLAQLDPSTLIIGTNVRLDARLDGQLVASVRERGVIEPIIGYTNEAGQVVVVAGQRRTLAAVQAGRATVPVLLTAAPQEADRIIDQLAENEHRTPVTETERVTAIEQLALIGLSAAQIAKRTATPRAAVDRGLSVAKSESARAALSDGITLEQAAALVEFEGQDEYADVLDATHRGSSGLEFTLQRARERRAERQDKEAVTTAAEAAGYTIIAAPPYSGQGPAQSLNSLTDAQGVVLTDETHATCPGAVVYLAREWVRVDAETGEPVQDEHEDEDGDWDDEPQEDDQEARRRAVRSVPSWRLAAACADWQAHGHRQLYSYGYGSASATRTKAEDMSEDERAEAKTARALVIRCNRDWATAQVVRREWVSRFLTRKTPPKDAGLVLASILTDHRWVIDGYKASAAATELLALPARATSSQTSDKRAYVIALGVSLAACEAAADRGDWRGPKASTAFYLNALAAWGYELAEVEQRAAGTYTETGQPD